MTSPYFAQPAPPPGRFSPSDQRRHRFVSRHPATAGGRVSGVFRAQLHNFAPGRVPRRHRRWLLEAEPHRRPGGDGAWGLLATSLALPAAAGLAAVALLKGIFYAPVYGVARLVQGRAWHGGWQSEAGRVLTRVRAGDQAKRFRNIDCLLVFTADHLLVLNDPANTELHEPFLLAEAPRGAVRLRPASPAKGPGNRLDLAFPDGSWLSMRLRRAGAATDAERLFPA